MSVSISHDHLASLISPRHIKTESKSPGKLITEARQARNFEPRDHMIAPMIGTHRSYS